MSGLFSCQQPAEKPAKEMPMFCTWYTYNEKEDFDSAMTMLKTRESMFLNCKCMRKFLELTPEQEKELNIVLDDLRALEMGNIKALEKNMEKVQQELKLTQQTEKIQQAYDFDENTRGNIINVTE